MYSYLQALAQSKGKSSLLNSYLLSGSINATLIALLILPSSVFLVNFQITILILELIAVIVSFLTNIFLKDIIEREIEKGKHTALISMADLCSFRNKNKSLSNAYSILSVILVAINMISVGWIGWAVFFTIMGTFSLSALFSFYEEFPAYVESLRLNESDIKV